MKYFAISLLLASLVLAAILCGLLLALGQNLPSPQGVRDVEPSVPTRILDRNGRLIDELYVEDRVPLRLSQVPEYFIQAVMAVEDRRFYQHWGIDPLGILRAAKADLLKGSTSQGASTITMQLARNIFLHHRRTWNRKMREAILTLRIEKAFSKDEILELYVNKIYFGQGAYGVESAARRFCGVGASELTLNQCAMIAGLIGNPAAFSPRRHPETSRWRRNVVLRAMLNTGSIDEATYHREREAPLALKNPTPTHTSGAYFTEMIRRQIAQTYGASEIYHAGLTVHTTLDLDLQDAAEEILESHLRLLEETNDYPYLHGNADSMLAQQGLPPEETLPAPLRLQAALVAQEPATGAIVALIGGRDFAESQWNRAVQAPRQSASAFKPFIYATAIRQGYRTTDILLDTPVEFEIPGAPPEEAIWKPTNFKETYHGPVTLRYALMRSINVPTARLLAAVGIKPVIQLAREMGVRSSLPQVLSLATGTGEITLLELTNAYAILANHGIRVDSYAIDRVINRHGGLTERHNPHSRQVLDEQTSFIVTDMLRSVLDGGTGKTARTSWGFHDQAAGKTGTYDDYTDAWFIGYTPNLAVGVWVGFDYKIPIGDKHSGTGAMAALPIWARFMKTAVAKTGSREFEVPEGLIMAETCIESGLLATPDCPITVQDVFLPGTEPREACRLHRGDPEPGDSFEDLDRQLLHRDHWLRHMP
ncbi:MAG: PBP1A family penicillin-binding protein [Candidatus Eisenbacteria sp.]|nr:PBP1A family penicillin-binding protein [Candidatus Eisenbacteria bacterium]